MDQQDLTDRIYNFLAKNWPGNLAPISDVCLRSLDATEGDGYIVLVIFELAVTRDGSCGLTARTQLSRSVAENAIKLQIFLGTLYNTIRSHLLKEGMGQPPIRAAAVRRALFDLPLSPLRNL